MRADRVLLLPGSRRVGCLKEKKRWSRRVAAARRECDVYCACLCLCLCPRSVRPRGLVQKVHRNMVASSLNTRLGFALVKPALCPAVPSFLGETLCEGRSSFTAALSRLGSCPLSRREQHDKAFGEIMGIVY